MEDTPKATGSAGVGRAITSASSLTTPSAPSWPGADDADAPCLPAASLVEFFAAGAYVNTLTDEGEPGIQRAYPKVKLARLTALKDRYDPGNVFPPQPQHPTDIAGPEPVS